MQYYLSLMEKVYLLEVPGHLTINQELAPFLYERIPFRMPVSGKIRIIEVNSIDGPESDETSCSSETPLTVRTYKNEQYNIYIRKYQEQKYLTKSVLAENEITVFCDSNFLEILKNTQVLLKRLFLESFFLLNRSFILHSSLIQFEGSAIAFCAPKQTGKSTQAALWEKKMGARILNGDRSGIKLPDLEEENQPIMAYGLPHAGSSSIYINEGAPLKAIILLEQAPENTLEPIPGNAAFSRMFSQVNVPRTDEKLLTLAIEHLEEVIRKVPVYLLKCTPDALAVKLVYNELYGKEECCPHD